MSENRNLRPWKCRCCGDVVMSKGGWSRTFSNDWDLMALTSISLCRVVDDPSRQVTDKTEVKVFLDRYRGFRGGEFCDLPGGGKDLEIRVTIPDTYDSAVDSRGPMTPQRAMKGYIDMIRRLPEEKIGKYVCYMTGGHDYEEMTDSASITELEKV